MPLIKEEIANGERFWAASCVEHKLFNTTWPGARRIWQASSRLPRS
nr:hypothetical protein [Rhizobium leguminosarum]